MTAIRRTIEKDDPDHGKVAVVTVEPGGWRFVAPAGMSLLQAGLLAGVRLPSSCRNGTCRECLCRLTSGEVRHRVEWPGLSAEEKRDGYILPCVALALSDLVLAAPRATCVNDLQV
jgi:ferredoxin